MFIYPQRSITNHTKATKEPDPFHQLYEQRKGKKAIVNSILIWWSDLPS